MSFILEALKKSEKNRKKNSAPSLATQHQSAPQTPTNRPSWIGILVLTVLLLNGGVILWLFGPWQQNTPKTTSQAIQAATNINSEAVTSPTIPSATQAQA